MTHHFKNTISRRALAAGSILLVIVLCLFFIGFVQQFVQYIMNVLFLASRASTHYLHILPVH